MTVIFGNYTFLDNLIVFSVAVDEGSYLHCWNLFGGVWASINSHDWCHGCILRKFPYCERTAGLFYI